MTANGYGSSDRDLMLLYGYRPEWLNGTIRRSEFSGFSPQEGGSMDPKTVPYALSRTVDLSYEEADRQIREELQNEGFGILTEIDVQATLKNKLGVDFPPYEILGACNPQIAHQALTLEPDVGLLLPCNVVVRRTEDNRTLVEIMDPISVLGIADNDALRPLGDEALARLERALERVAAD
jgi:uncharacterized protein (DUF302 family)